MSAAGDDPAALGTISDVTGGLASDSTSEPMNPQSQDNELKSNAVRVLVRLRPQLQHEEHLSCTCLQSTLNKPGNPERNRTNNILLETPKGGRPSAITRKSKLDMRDPEGSHKDTSSTRSWEFKFDRVIGSEQSQADVFEQGGVGEMVDKVLDGFHGTVFAYGQTGSGKTYTMDGLQQHHLPHDR
jgi:hypothetical protein